jgi:hypothetical protein
MQTKDMEGTKWGLIMETEIIVGVLLGLFAVYLAIKL